MSVESEVYESGDVYKSSRLAEFGIPSGATVETVIKALCEDYDAVMDGGNMSLHYAKQLRSFEKLTENQKNAVYKAFVYKEELVKALEVYKWLNGRPYELPEMLMEDELF